MSGARADPARGRHAFWRFGKDVARGLAIRFDCGPQYIAAWINEVKWLGFMISPSYVGEPQCNGVAERFMRQALNRQPVWKRSTGLVPRARVPVHQPNPHLTSNRRDTMKIVVIGGTGLIGTKVVKRLTEQGHQTMAASPNTGVNAVTGQGLAEALAGAQVVVDLSNSPSFETAAALAFFESSARNLARAEREASVRHHVALSVVGTDRLQDSGYFPAKLAQEQAIKKAGIPYTIVRATQFFEFLGAIAAAGTEDTRVRLSNASFQPIAADDVAKAVADAAVGAPLNDTIEIAGPERLPLSEMVARYLKATNDSREVVSDPQARYFGARLDDRTLVPGDHAHLGTIRLEDWLRQPRTR